MPACSSESKAHICVIFPSHHMKKEACNHSEWPDLTDAVQPFFPLPCPKADWVTISHAISFINITHVMVINHHNVQFYSIYLFITEISFLSWIVHINQQSGFSLVHPVYYCEVTSGFNLNIFPSHFQFCIFSPPTCPSCLAWQFQNS